MPSFARALPPLVAPSAGPTSLSVTTQLVDHEIKLGFEYWTAEQILRAALPPSIIEITSSFETIGHIAHMNLRDKQLPYKALIGQVGLGPNQSGTCPFDGRGWWPGASLWVRHTLCAKIARGKHRGVPEILNLDQQAPLPAVRGDAVRLALQVIFEKNKGIRTVVNKMTGIDQKFRSVPEATSCDVDPTHRLGCSFPDPIPTPPVAARSAHQYGNSAACFFIDLQT